MFSDLYDRNPTKSLKVPQGGMGGVVALGVDAGLAFTSLAVGFRDPLTSALAIPPTDPHVSADESDSH